MLTNDQEFQKSRKLKSTVKPPVHSAHLSTQILQRLRFFRIPLTYLASYAAWTLGIRLITLTFITYLVNSPSARLQDISDAFSSNEVTFMGISALLYVAFLYGLNPLTSMPLSEIITRPRIEKGFLPGFVQGAFFSGGMILAFVLSGNYRYLGYYIQLDEAPLEMLNVLLRMAALGVLSYCEEYLFRAKLLKSMEGSLPQWASMNLIAIFYCGIKLLQFDLGWMQLITLYLVSLALSCRFALDRQFSRGAGFWAAILIVFQPLLSLPIFGNNFSGILLVKYLSAKDGLELANHEILGATWGAWNASFGFFSRPLASGVSLFSWEFSWASCKSLFGQLFSSRVLSGGMGGPLSSFIFQILLILDIGRSIIIRETKPKKTSS